ncbi:hypothetical protein F9L07_17185 [Pimelobacter simplex]|uniref:Exo-alpha-sialidase n=1 Tax=Nocardioides simplex TaxID=2045 RepID=A0A7J5DUC3_NOCSI|nr:sialidase family protein [Pimelobacter simplex]KAB2808825.1 hypothetical protein F9L07_17185 [Pimelobacter simplex]
MSRTLALGAALLALVLVASGCGDRPAPPADAQGEWSGQRLAGPVGADHSPRLVTDGDDALVLLVSERGRVQPHVSRDGAPFAAGTPFATGLDGFFDVLTPVRLADGSWYTVATGGDDYVVRALRSADGLTWTVEPTTGVTDRTELSALVATADGVVAVGVRRHAADPSMGGFSALAWRSDDGRGFTEVALPGVPAYRGYRSESSVSGLVPVAGGALLATGRAGRSVRLWRSADHGASWTVVDDPLVARADGIERPIAYGDRVLAAVSGLSHPTLLSDDGGRSWRINRGLSVPFESDEPVWLWQAGSRMLTVRSPADDGVDWNRPEVCYADLDQCRAGAGPGPRLALSEDGEHWRAVAGPTDVTAPPRPPTAGCSCCVRVRRGRSWTPGRPASRWPTRPPWTGHGPSTWSGSPTASGPRSAPATPRRCSPTAASTRSGSASRAGSAPTTDPATTAATGRPRAGRSRPAAVASTATPLSAPTGCSPTPTATGRCWRRTRRRRSPSCARERGSGVTEVARRRGAGS